MIGKHVKLLLGKVLKYQTSAQDQGKYMPSLVFSSPLGEKT